MALQNKKQFIFRITNKNEVIEDGTKFRTEIHMARSSEVISLDMITFHNVWGNLSYDGSFGYYDAGGYTDITLSKARGWKADDLKTTLETFGFTITYVADQLKVASISRPTGWRPVGQCWKQLGLDDEQLSITSLNAAYVPNGFVNLQTGGYTVVVPELGQTISDGFFIPNSAAFGGFVQFVRGSHTHHHTTSQPLQLPSITMEFYDRFGKMLQTDHVPNIIAYFGY